MRIQFQSDLHLEFMPDPSDYSIPRTDADVIVIAGDIGVNSEIRYIDWVLDETHDKPTIVVAGNHEAYMSTWQQCYRNWRHATKGTHVHFLEQEVVELGEVRFLGATLFTDYLLDGDRIKSMSCADIGMNDHRLVYLEPRNERFKASDALGIHLATREFLDTELKKDYAGKTVIVTHHAPSSRCFIKTVARSNICRSDLLAPAYASDLENIMASYEISVWFHGHLHHSVDLQIHRTRVLCNPRGYWPNSLNPAFEPDKVVDIH